MEHYWEIFLALHSGIFGCPELCSHQMRWNVFLNSIFPLVVKLLSSDTQREIYSTSEPITHIYSFLTETRFIKQYLLLLHMILSDTCLSVCSPPFPSLAFLKMLVVTHQTDPMTYQRIVICRLKTFFSSSHCFVPHNSFKGWCPPTAQAQIHSHLLRQTLCRTSPSPCPFSLISNDHPLFTSFFHFTST